MLINLESISSSIIRESGVTFGTSGARGLVTQFTSDVCAAFTAAFIHGMKRKFNFDTIAIAIDNRPSSYGIAKACAAVLQQLDVAVIYYGVIPTPALAFASQENGIPAIMVTGSHIPFDRNGLKFYRPDGEITKSDEKVIMNGNVTFNALSQFPDLITNNYAAEKYITRYTSLFSTACLVGKRIGIYEHSSSGRDLYYRIFEALGAEVISLDRSDEFVPIDTEAVSEEDTLKAINWSKEYNLDAVFSTDGDGDRPLISDENGYWLRGDILGLLAAEALRIEALSIPVSCNTTIESCGKFKYVERTKIGSPYVIAEFKKLNKEYKTVAGFEANGGFLLGSDLIINGNKLKALKTRDAILPALMLLSSAKNDSISKLVRALPQRFTYSDRIQNFATDKSQQILAQGNRNPKYFLNQLGFEGARIKSIDNTDGLRIVLSDNCIIHLRPSGNAPELRCYAEANNYSEAKIIVRKALGNISEYNI